MNARDKAEFEEWRRLFLDRWGDAPTIADCAEWGIRRGRREMRREVEEAVRDGAGVCELCGVQVCHAHGQFCNFKLRLKARR